MNILCLIALVVCAVAVQAEKEECFRKATKEEIKMKQEKLEECENEVNKSNPNAQKLITKCIFRKTGIMVGNKIDYNKLVEVIKRDSLPHKIEMFLAAVRECKYKHPDSTDEFFKCYSDVAQEGCSKPQ